MYNVLSAQFWQSTSSAPTNIERNFPCTREGQVNVTCGEYLFKLVWDNFPPCLLPCCPHNEFKQHGNGSWGIDADSESFEDIASHLIHKGQKENGALYFKHFKYLKYDFNFGGCILRSFVGYSHLDQTSLFNKFISSKALHCDALNHRKGCKLKIQRCARKDWNLLRTNERVMNKRYIFKTSTIDFWLSLWKRIFEMRQFGMP